MPISVNKALFRKYPIFFTVKLNIVFLFQTRAKRIWHLQNPAPPARSHRQRLAYLQFRLMLLRRMWKPFLKKVHQPLLMQTMQLDLQFQLMIHLLVKIYQQLPPVLRLPHCPACPLLFPQGPSHLSHYSLQLPLYLQVCPIVLL